MSASPLPFVMRPDYRASFVAGYFQVKLVTNVTLYRLLGRDENGRMNFILGQRPWFEEKTFFDCVCDVLDDGRDSAAALASLRFLLRDRLAVSANWNDFRSYVALRVPRNPGITAAVGPADAQPYLIGGHSPGRNLAPLILAGGATQYVIDVEPGMRSWIVGPQPLLMARA